MKWRTLGFLFFAAALFSRMARPSDPPHWSSSSTAIDCTTQCHTLHGASGGNLTSAAGNVTLCQSCHRAGGIAGAKPLNDSDKANILTAAGSSHAFNVSAVNADCGASIPSDPRNSAMIQRVTGFGNMVVCSSCHDQHAGVSTLGGTPHVSASILVSAFGSTGSVVSGGSYTGAAGAWYLIEVVTPGSESTAGFRYSKDNGLSWFGWDGASWVPYSGNPRTAAGATPIPLDSGVVVSFSPGSFAANERWQFNASWPFLRVKPDSGDNATGDTFCRDCHRDWVMDHNGTNTYNAAAYRSHPVGEALNADGQHAYDRVSGGVPQILDGNGVAQGSAGQDAYPRNDLRLDSGNRVQCLTCHSVHYAYSNTNGSALP